MAGPILDEVIFETLFQSLKLNNWNRTTTAHSLGRSVRWVRNKLPLLKAAGYEIEENPDAIPTPPEPPIIETNRFMLLYPDY